MDKHIWWAWAVKNSVAIVSWVMLAVLFDKWWVAFGGWLFTSDLKTER